ncbi:MAG: helix-turn-helix domain-containing protein [Bacteroidales bacterium]|jgi:excisionase family DNA binding protein|nr:helix-turn-helix domain-containing protein [Bacteroidales bacterium]
MEKIISKIEEQNLRLKSIEELLHLSKKVLNIDEVCKLTGLSKSSIYRCTHKGTIPFYKQAKHLFFDKLEIESWLKENRGYNVKDDSNY